LTRSDTKQLVRDAERRVELRRTTRRSLLVLRYKDGGEAMSGNLLSPSVGWELYLKDIFAINPLREEKIHEVGEYRMDLDIFVEETHVSLGNMLIEVWQPGILRPGEHEIAQ